MPYSYPYPRPALTADIALLTPEIEPRILLIRRKHDPFAGKWALPGGFVDEGETILQAAERELLEETGLSGIVLAQVGTFGDPGRDPRGWTVSVVYWAEVAEDAVKASAGDDAAEVGWFPLTALPELAFDHAAIVASLW